MTLSRVMSVTSPGSGLASSAITIMPQQGSLLPPLVLNVAREVDILICTPLATTYLV